MLRHDNAVVLQRRQRAGRHAVVIGKHRGEAEIAPQQFDHRRFTALHIRGAGTDPAVRGDDALLLQRFAPPFPAHIVIFNAVV